MFSYLNPLPQLPTYKGPYKVGSSEYEIPVSEIPSSTRIPDSSIDTIKFRIFYPTAQSSSSKKSIPWLPQPQKEWNRAYATFLGFSERSSTFMANIPSILNYATIPAVQNAPLLENSDAKPWPVVVFSHGLGGNFNAYSAFAGSLASCGVIVIAPEHRDQSAPVSFIRSSRDKPARPVLYRRFSHKPTVDVLNGRNAMLRVRMWELEKVFTAMSSVNSGKSFSNLADSVSENMPNFRDSLDLGPSRITWAGHSFGSATMVQFVKSVYYHQHAPAQPNTDDDKEGWDWTPLYTPAENHDLSKQITPNSPMILLDLWTMPLRSKTTQWLWERPLPCYDRKDSDSTSSCVISIMSTEFYKWSDMVDRTKALLSARPVEAYEQLLQRSEKEKKAKAEAGQTSEPSRNLSADPITRLETSKSRSDSSPPPPPSRKSQDSEVEALRSESMFLSPPQSNTSTRTPSPSSARSSSPLSTSPSSTSSTPNPSQSAIQPYLYYIPQSAHLSQSDFGVLFPNMTKYLLKVADAEETMALNVRGALAMMSGCGLTVKTLPLKSEGFEDTILVKGGMEGQRWERLNLESL